MAEIIDNNIGKFNLKRFRELLTQAIGKRTQQEFASDSGVSRVTINRLLMYDDVQRPALNTVAKIAAVASGNTDPKEFYEACGYTYPEYRSSERSARSNMNYTKRAIAILDDIEKAVKDHPSGNTVDIIRLILASSMDKIGIRSECTAVLPLKLKDAPDQMLLDPEGGQAVVFTAYVNEIDRVNNTATEINAVFALIFEKHGSREGTEYRVKGMIRKARSINLLGYEMEMPSGDDIISYVNMRTHRENHFSEPIDCYACIIEKKIPPLTKATAKTPEEKLMHALFGEKDPESVSLPMTNINYGIPLKDVKDSAMIKFIASNGRYLRLYTKEETYELMSVLKEGTDKEALAALEAAGMNPAEAVCRIINGILASDPEFKTLLKERKSVLYSFLDPGTGQRSGVPDMNDGVTSLPVVDYYSNEEFPGGGLPPVIMADEFYTDTLNLCTPITSVLTRVSRAIGGPADINEVAAFEILEMPKEDISIKPDKKG